MCAPPNLFPLPVSEFQDSARALNNVRNDFIFPFRADKIFGAIQAGQPCKTGNTCCAISLATPPSRATGLELLKLSLKYRNRVLPHSEEVPDCIACLQWQDQQNKPKKQLKQNSIKIFL